VARVAPLAGVAEASGGKSGGGGGESRHGRGPVSVVSWLSCYFSPAVSFPGGVVFFGPPTPGIFFCPLLPSPVADWCRCVPASGGAAAVASASGSPGGRRLPPPSP